MWSWTEQIDVLLDDLSRVEVHADAADGILKDDAEPVGPALLEAGHGDAEGGADATVDGLVGA